MRLFQRSEICHPSEYSPLWEHPAAPPPELPEPNAQETEEQSLNRLQRSLIWFAAILIAVSMFQNFQNNF
jgi:hypothetical protein